MSLEEYRDRQRQAYLQRKRERELNGDNEDSEMSLASSQSTPALNEASSSSSGLTFGETQRLGSDPCLSPSTDIDSLTGNNRFTAPSLPSSSAFHKNPITTTLTPTSIESAVSSSSSSSNGTNRKPFFKHPSPTPLHPNAKPLYPSSPHPSVPEDLSHTTNDDTSSDALLAQMLAAEMDEESKKTHPPPVEEELDEASAAAIAQLIASDADETESGGVRIPDAVFEEQLISDFRSGPPPVVEPIPDDELARRLQEEEFLRDGSPPSPRHTSGNLW